MADQARDAAEAIEIEFETLPSITGIASRTAAPGRRGQLAASPTRRIRWITCGVERPAHGPAAPDDLDPHGCRVGC